MKTIRIGIAGVGRLGLMHAHNIYHMQGVELTAVSNLDAAVNKEIQHKYSVPYAYTTYHDMIMNKDLDAVCIVTPSGFHTQHIREALKQGLHVFCEKPIGLDVKDIENTINDIEKSSSVFHLGFMRRYDPEYIHVKEMIRNGELGDISFIRSYGFDPISQLDSFVSFAKKSPSGGLFLDMCVHDIDIIRWFTQSEITRVWASGNNKAAPELNELGEVEFGTVTMELSNNTTAFIAAGRTANHGYHVETEVIGTKGMVRIAATPDKNKVMLFNEHGVVRPSSQHFLERFKEAYVNEIEEFISCIREERQPEVSAWDGLRSTEAAIACQKSYEEKRLIEL